MQLSYTKAVQRNFFKTIFGNSGNDVRRLDLMMHAFDNKINKLIIILEVRTPSVEF